MNFLDKITGDNISNSYSLTELGHKKADDLMGSDWRAIFISYISENQPCTIDDISEKTGCDLHKTKVRIKLLCSEGWVMKGKGDRSV
jgi:hypothetical protein